jgi:pyridoxal phosphate enzyme (YggS family)
VPSYDYVRDNLLAVRDRLERAARAVGRDAASVRLVAISKTFPAEAVRAACDAGQLDFGENRVQEALQKMHATADTGVRWHLVGHLQANKARKAAPSFACIHSVDSVDLLRRIDKAAAEAGTAPDLLIQADLAGEDTKFGAPEAAVEAMLREPVTAARIVGLMLLPPYADNPDDVRPWFRRLVALRDRLLGDGVPPDRLRELSMGMSHDFEVAVQEGSTIVRVGTAIFGERRPGAGTENG